MTAQLFPRKLLAAVVAVLVFGSILPAAPADAAVSVGDVWTDKARYAPGEQITVTAEVTGTGPVSFSLAHLGTVMASGSVTAGGSGQVVWSVVPPARDGIGYLVHVDSGSSRGQTAVDVSSSWLLFPRMGFLADFRPSLSEATQREQVGQLSKDYHLNSLQFYDWMWRHEQPIQRIGGSLPSTWASWTGDVIGPGTVSGFARRSRELGVAALPYSMSYAALQGFEAFGVDPAWRLRYRSTGEDWKFQMLPNEPDTTLWIMNPGHGAWRSHMTAQYADQAQTIGFDGTHVDQLGNWGNASDGGMMDVEGKNVDLPSAFVQLVGAAVTATGKPVGMNAVDGFGADQLAGSASAYLYTEFWEALEDHNQVKSYLERQRQLSGGKPAVVAAYVNYRHNLGQRYEAESGTRDGAAAVDNDHPGYTGTGFVDSYGATGDSVTVTVTVPESRRYGIVPRWSNGTGATATRTLMVDGVVRDRFKLAPTVDWDTWEDEGGTSAYLAAGTHTVTLAVRSGDWGYVNLDSVTLGTFNDPSVKLAGAMLAANGASHIELGQSDQMLVAPYFLDDTKQMSSSLKAWMGAYYDVVTAYENLLFGPTLRTLDNRVEIAGRNVSTTGAPGTVWANVMRNEGVDVIHLLNLVGNDDRWRNPAATPPALTDLPVKYYLDHSPVPSTVHVASPDLEAGRSQQLAFTTGEDAGGRYLSFTVPQLRVWDMVYIGQSTAGNGNVVTKASKCLDLAGGSTANGTTVQLWDCASVPAQKWTYSGEKLKAGGKCLDLYQGGTANGTRAHLWDCVDVPSQQWIRTAQAQYRNPVSGRCLDVVGNLATNGTTVHLWDCHSGASQKWTLPR